MTESEAVTYLDAAGAAAAVGVGTSGLRRLAPSYEAVYGELPRAGKGSADSPRLWSTVAVRRLAAARRAVEVGQYKSVLVALEALQGQETTGDDLEAGLPGARPTDRQLLEALLREVSVLRAELAEMKQLGPAQIDAGTDKAGSRKEQGDDHARRGLLVRAAIRLEGWLKRFR